MKDEPFPYKRVEAAQWGLLPDTGRDSTARFQTLLDANPENTEMNLLPGRYDFFPEFAQKRQFAMSNSDEDGPRTCALLLEGKRRVVLNGNGATFVFHGQMMPITMDRCSGIVLRAVTIDWDIPLSAEGTVVSACETYADLAIDEKQFPHSVRDGRLFFRGENWEEPLWPAGHIEFDIAGHVVAYQRGDRFPRTRQEMLPDGRVRFWGNFAGICPKVGNEVVLRHGRRLHAGIFVNECEDISLENISLHACGGLGILAQFSKDLSFLGVSVTPNRQRGRQFVCGHDDGIHLSNNSGTVVLERCSFQGLMDDPVNLHGTAARIESMENPFTLKGRFVHPQSRGFPHWAVAGQRISFVHAGTLASLGQGTVADFRLCTRDTFRLSLTQPVPEKVRPGDALENLSNTASLICRNNHFGGCRARGLLVCTPQPVLVEGNLFESSGAAILIAGDASDWYESGSCGQVEIRNNFFSDACLTSAYEGGDAVITIHPHIAQLSRETPYHRNLQIHGNLFYTSDAPVLYAQSTAGLVFRDNRILRSCRYASWNRQKSMFSFDSCTQVVLERNACVGQVLGKRIEINSMMPQDIRQDMGFPISEANKEG